MDKFPTEIKQGNTLPYIFIFHTKTKCPFQVLFTAMVFLLQFFSIFMGYLKWPPSIVLMYSLVFLNARRLWCG
jgi:hypothetical protein